jgi:hypothetical protein
VKLIIKETSFFEDAENTKKKIMIYISRFQEGSDRLKASLSIKVSLIIYRLFKQQNLNSRHLLNSR